jgi:hypothetical protein
LAAGIPARLTPAEGRKFGLTVGGAFLAVSALLWWRERESVMAVTLTLGTLLILAALLVPGRMGPVYRGWMRFGLALSRITTPIFMSVVFFGVITPLGLIKKLFRGPRLIPSRAAPTYWQDRSRNDRRGDLNRQF